MSAVITGAATTLCPSNLHVSVTSRFSTGPRLTERVEQKFFILPHRQSVALALLRRTCRSDKEYPAGQVNSLYFDTPDLDQHGRSDSGEYTKDKVRIRWYGEEWGLHHELDCSQEAPSPSKPRRTQTSVADRSECGSS